MSFVGDLLGFGDNAGSNFRATPAQLLQPTNIGQADTAYGNAQSGLAQQQAFVHALMNTGGLQNQSSVFAQQQALANQLQGVANGTGPNPALQQLQNTTGQNVNAQAALMAGQRGVSANPGLIARQIAQQGAGIQQQAVGQGAALAAQQQLSGLGALQNQQGLLANQANTQVGQQANALLGYNQAAQSEQQQLLNSLANYNSTKVANQSNVNNANAGIANTTAQGQQGLLGGALAGAGAALLLHQGGQVKGYADGGAVNEPQSFAGKFLKGFHDQMVPADQNQMMASPLTSMGGGAQNPGAQSLNQGMNSLASGLAQSLNKGGPISGEMLASQGKMVPGKAAVSGDSLKNDKVPAMLSPKEIVIPRSIAMSADAPEKAKQFVAAILAKNGMRGMK